MIFTGWLIAFIIVLIFWGPVVIWWIGKSIAEKSAVGALVGTAFLALPIILLGFKALSSQS